MPNCCYIIRPFTVNSCAKPNPLHLNTAFNLYFTSGLSKKPLSWLGRGASWPVHGRNLSDCPQRQPRKRSRVSSSTHGSLVGTHHTDSPCCPALTITPPTPALSPHLISSGSSSSHLLDLKNLAQLMSKNQHTL